MMGVSQTTPVPPGPSLSFNKYFITDDRTDDGWTVFSDGPADTVGGGAWTLTRNGYLYKSQAWGAGSKIRAFFSVTNVTYTVGTEPYFEIQVIMGIYSCRIYARRYNDDTVTISAVDMIGDSHSIASIPGASSGVWLEISYGGSFKAYNSSFSEVFSFSGTIFGWQQTYVSVITGAVNYPRVQMKQVSYDRT